MFSSIRKKIDEAHAVFGIFLLNMEAGLFLTVGTTANLPDVSDIGLRIILSNRELYDLLRKVHTPALNRREWNENKEITMKATQLVVPRNSSPISRNHLHIIK